MAPREHPRQDHPGQAGRRRALSRRHMLAAGMGGTALLLSGALAGCTDPPQAPRFPALRFSHKPPFLFRATRVEVRSEYSRPNRPPNVEHQMPLPPDRAAGHWAEDRLQANGEGDAIVRFTVHDASVVEKKLTVERGISGLLQNEQAESYHAQLEATVEVVDELTGIALAAATAKVWRSQTLAENATINERDSVWFGLVERLITEFDAAMTAQIEAHLDRVLLNPPSA